MPTYVVETFTASLMRRTWLAPSVEVAEVLARKLSVAAVDDPTYPNPFLVVESDGSPRCQFLGGTGKAFSSSREQCSCAE